MTSLATNSFIFNGNETAYSSENSKYYSNSISRKLATSSVVLGLLFVLPVNPINNYVIQDYSQISSDIIPDSVLVFNRFNVDKETRQYLDCNPNLYGELNIVKTLIDKAFGKIQANVSINLNETGEYEGLLLDLKQILGWIKLVKF